MPGKFVIRRGRLRASRDPKALSPTSILMADAIALSFERALDRNARGRLLDLGCGRVPLFAAYRRHVGEIICVDWGRSLHGCLHLDCSADLSAELPFGDSRFDTVILSDVLEHVPRPLLLWREIARVLAPGGRVLVSVPFYYPLHERPRDYYRYTEHGLRWLAEQSGMTVISIEPLGGAPEVAADVISKSMLRMPWPLSYLARWLQRLASALVSRGPGRRFSRATASRFPFGYFMVAEKPERREFPKTRSNGPGPS